MNQQLINESAGPQPSRSLARAFFEAVRGHPVLAAFLVALAVRALLVATIDFFPESYVFAVDNSTYSGMATAVMTGAAETWDEGTRGLYSSTFTFMGPVTLIYFLTDSNEVVAELYVALLGAGTAALVTRLAMEFLPRTLALFAGLAVGLLPSQVLWSSLLLKDAAVWILLAAIALAMAVAGRKTGGRMLACVLLAACLLLALGYLRGHTTVVAAWALGLAGFAGVATQRWIRGALSLAVAVVVPFMAGLGPAGFDFVANAGSLEYRRAANALGAQSAFVEALSPEELSGEVSAPAEVERVEKQIAETEERLAAASQGAQPAQPATSSGATPPDMATDPEALEKQLEELRRERERLVAIAPAPPGEDEGLDPSITHLPKGLSVMLFEPVPWSQGSSPTFQLARGEALLWYPFLALAVVGLRGARGQMRSLTFPMLAGGGMLFVYALAEGNIGTAFRHRGEFVWVVALLAALGLQSIISGRRIDREASMEA